MNLARDGCETPGFPPPAKFLIVFESILVQMGPFNSTPEKSMPMTVEAWPGGRWFRDPGADSKHDSPRQLYAVV